MRRMNMKKVTMKLFLFVLVTTAICIYGQAFAYTGSSGLIVDTKFVMDKIGKPGWVLLDMRFPEEFVEGHIPGAVELPAWVAKVYADDMKRQASVRARMERMIGELGIGGDSHVIVYGDPVLIGWSTVMFWVLEDFGCNSVLQKCTVQFYDGGVNRWQADGGMLDKGETKPKPVPFKAAAGVKRGAKADEMLRIVEGNQKAFVVDVRTLDEYNGMDVRALRGGHIPRAINIDVAKNFDPETYRMLPLDQLRDLYRDVPKEQRVITYCQTGGRAAYTYLVLRALGYWNVAIYDDGWRVYGSDLKFPVEDETWYDFNRLSGTIKAVNKMQEIIQLRP
jgi:thiosulfate/3-mercaptopyruvate sulfurtransferase